MDGVYKGAMVCFFRALKSHSEREHLAMDAASLELTTVEHRQLTQLEL